MSVREWIWMQFKSCAGPQIYLFKPLRRRPELSAEVLKEKTDLRTIILSKKALAKS